MDLLKTVMVKNMKNKIDEQLINKTLKSYSKFLIFNFIQTMIQFKLIILIIFNKNTAPLLLNLNQEKLQINILKSTTIKQLMEIY